MLFTTASEWAVLLLVLVAGWLFGLASHSGGRKWRDRYTAERDAHAAYRRDADARVAAERETHVGAGRDAEGRIASADARIAELERENARLAHTHTDRDTHVGVSRDADDRLSAANTRIAELERENARLAHAAPVTAQTIAPRERMVIRPSASDAARPAYPAGERRGWFDWGTRR